MELFCYLASPTRSMRRCPAQAPRAGLCWDPDRPHDSCPGAQISPGCSKAEWGSPPASSPPMNKPRHTLPWTQRAASVFSALENRRVTSLRSCVHGEDFWFQATKAIWDSRRQKRVLSVWQQGRLEGPRAGTQLGVQQMADSGHGLEIVSPVLSSDTFLMLTSFTFLSFPCSPRLMPCITTASPSPLSLARSLAYFLLLILPSPSFPVIDPPKILADGRIYTCQCNLQKAFLKKSHALTPLPFQLHFASGLTTTEATMAYKELQGKTVNGQ